MAKSRLGKGLGALFPLIPEEVEQEEQAQTTSKTSDSDSVVRPQKSKSAAASNGESAAHKSRLSQKGKKSAKSRDRAAIPNWDNIAHPSDMFFSTTNETSASAKNVSRETSPTDLQPVNGAYLAEIQVKDIVPNAHQPRTIFAEEELEELAASIKEVGVLQPIVVRKTGDSYELIMGERRWRASQQAGESTIPAIVRVTDDSDMLRDALLENLHRVQLNPLEEAAAYQQMIEEFGLTQAQLSQSVSKSRPQITNTLRLLQLPASIQKRVASGVLSAGHARALLTMETEKDMQELAQRIVAEGLSVRSTEELVALWKNRSSRTETPRSDSSRNYWKSSDLPQRLGDRFDTKVSIRGSQKRGRIEIVFSSPEDLDRITSLLAGADATKDSDGWH